MPSKNSLKEQAPESYYHVYVRGANRQKIFFESADYKYFIKLFERYLAKKQSANKLGTLYPKYTGKIELLAYCLMSNHVHLFVYQQEVPYLEKFMRSLLTSYSRYFNLKYKRTGPLFEGRYKAVRTDNDSYLQHITRYIHLNPRLWRNYRHSSLTYYQRADRPDWLVPERILGLFRSKDEYMEFVADYEQMKDTLAKIKYQLADS